MIWTSKGSMHPHQFLRSPKWRSWITLPSMYLAGIGVCLFTLSTQPEGMPHISLLLIEKVGKFHYTWIKDLNRLLYNQSKHREHKRFCERCLHGYKTEDLLEAHRPDCRGIGQTALWVEMPEERKNKLTFQNHHKQLPALFIIYADFEALTSKIEGP